MAYTTRSPEYDIFVNDVSYYVNFGTVARVTVKPSHLVAATSCEIFDHSICMKTLNF